MNNTGDAPCSKKRSVNVMLGDSNQVINASLASTKRLRSTTVNQVPCQVCGKLSRSSTLTRSAHPPPENMVVDGLDILKNNGVPVARRSGFVVCEACKKFSSRFAARISANRNSPDCDEWMTKCGCRKMMSPNMPDVSEPGFLDRSLADMCRWCRFRRCHALGLVVDSEVKAALKGPIDLHEVPCAICAAPSSGYHFGVISCEGCKGFYRRTIHHNLENSYVCESNGPEPCDVTSQGGRRCKKCRFAKCTALGMSLAAIRTGRHSYQLRAETKAHLAQLQTAASNNDAISPNSVCFDAGSKLHPPSTPVSEPLVEVRTTSHFLTPSSSEPNSTQPSPFDMTMPNELFNDSNDVILSQPEPPVDDPCKRNGMVHTPDSDIFQMLPNGSAQSLDSSGQSPAPSDIQVQDAIVRMKQPCEKSPFVWLYDSAGEYVDLREPNPRPTLSNSLSTNDKDPLHILDDYFFVTPILPDGLTSTQLPMADASRVQWVIRRVVQSSRLIGNIAGVRTIVRPEMAPGDVFQAMVNHFDSFSRFVLHFVKSLPGFDSICLPDRTRLFVESLFPLLSAQLSLDYDEVSHTPNICGLQPGPGRQLAFKYFYHLGVAEPSMKDAGISMKQARLCVIEFSMICGLLYFNPDVSGLAEPARVRSIYEEYKRAAEIFIARNFRMNGSTTADSRISLFYSQLAYFRSFYQFFSWLLCDFGQHYPDYIGLDPWLSEFHGRICKVNNSTPPSRPSPGPQCQPGPSKMTPQTSPFAYGFLG